MKTKNLVGILVLFLCVMSLAACSDDDEKQEFTPLHFEFESLETTEGTGGIMFVYTGSGNISLDVRNTDIIDASYEVNEHYGEIILGGSSNHLGQINITGKMKGETSILVKDNVTKETVELRIKITDKYLGFTMQSGGNHPALTEDIHFFLVDNDAHDCYFFLWDHLNNKLRETPIVKGKYEFSVEKEGNGTIPYMTLTYPSDENGKFTRAAIAPTPHKFNILKSNDAVYSAFRTHLGVDWDALAGTKSNIRSYTLQMKEVGTEYAATAEMTNGGIPEGVL